MYPRLKTTLTVTMLLLALLPCLARAADGLAKITDGVYGYVDDGPGTPGNLYAANVGVIVGDDSVLVVDTLTSADEARLLIADIRKLTDKPIRFVVNTHYHLDHAFGNSAFADIGAMIVSHAACHDMLADHGAQVMDSPTAWLLPSDFWSRTRLVIPSVTFRRELNLNLGNLPVKLVHTGHPSHSPGCLMVLLPTRRTIFAGDILFTDVHPFLGEADLPGWAKNLDWLAAQDVDIIVPGHGPLSGKQDVADLKAYLAFFDSTAKRLCEILDDPEAITAEMLRRLPRKDWGEPLVGMNIRMKYAGQAEAAAH